MDGYATFAILYEKHKWLVKYLCKGDEDFEQEVWLDIWKNIARGNFKSTAPAYVHTAINHSLGMARRFKRYRPFEVYIEDILGEAWSAVPDAVHEFELKEWLKGLFARFTPKEAETLKLIIAGYDGEEISRMQKNTRQCVSKTKRRAQRKAKEYMNKKMNQ